MKFPYPLTDVWFWFSFVSIAACWVLWWQFRKTVNDFKSLLDNIKSYEKIIQRYQTLVKNYASLQNDQ